MLEKLGVNLAVLTARSALLTGTCIFPIPDKLLVSTPVFPSSLSDLEINQSEISSRFSTTTIVFFRPTMAW